MVPPPLQGSTLMGLSRLPSEPEKIYKLLYHNNDFLENIWKEEGFKGTPPLLPLNPN